ncbi:hypothetical protein [Dokdonia sp.]|uniref:hypothetical protein n=1 Tax=Dokdonia sp. TaxID=2024995 RepID=UPI0032632FF1
MRFSIEYFLKLLKTNLNRSLYLFVPSFILLITTSGCASFSKKEFSREYVRLEKNSISKLDGQYRFYPKKCFGDYYKDVPSDSLKYKNLFQNIVYEEREERERWDSLTAPKKDLSVVLKLNGNTELSITVFENKKIVRDTVLTGKLRQGMFYLDDKYLKIRGIPFLFGGYNSNKRRIGISKNDGLIVNEAYGNEGGILIILGSGYTSNASYEYERIDD